MVVATVVDMTATGLVYLAFALPMSLLLIFLSRRWLAGALAGSVLAMVLTALLKHQLPFYFSAHANDFIIEPFLDAKFLAHPLEALLSLIFHVGVPTMVFGLVWYGTGRPTRKSIMRTALRMLVTGGMLLTVAWLAWVIDDAGRMNIISRRAEILGEWAAWGIALLFAVYGGIAVWLSAREINPHRKRTLRNCARATLVFGLLFYALVYVTIIRYFFDRS